MPKNKKRMLKPQHIFSLGAAGKEKISRNRAGTKIPYSSFKSFREGKRHYIVGTLEGTNKRSGKPSISYLWHIPMKKLRKIDPRKAERVKLGLSEQTRLVATAELYRYNAPKTKRLFSEANALTEWKYGDRAVHLQSAGIDKIMKDRGIFNEFVLDSIRHAKKLGYSIALVDMEDRPDHIIALFHNKELGFRRLGNSGWYFKRA